jgi:hypothetical protein
MLGDILGDIRVAARQALIIATCGLGLLSEATARQPFALARQTGKLIENLTVPWRE